MDTHLRPARRTLYRSARPRRTPGWLLRWHRRVGAALALWLLFLCVSGLLLNHGNALGLDRRHLEWSWLLSLYGMEDPVPSSGWQMRGHYLSRYGERLFIDDIPLPELPSGLVAALAHQGEIVVASDHALFLLTEEGQVIDRQDSLDGLPSLLRGLGLTGGGTLAVRGDEGVYLPDPGTGLWLRQSGETVHWATPVALPDDLRERLALAQRGTGPTLERLLLDLHSGRVFSRYGVLLADLAAVLLALLALSGLWMWWPRRRRGPSPR